MEFYKPKNTIKDPICLYYIPNDGWLTDKVDMVVTKLKDKSFFRRFNKLQIVSEYYSTFAETIHEKDECKALQSR
jgi:hypothetical protein